MTRKTAGALACGFVVVVAAACRAEITVVFDRNEGDAATAEFKFPRVGPPSRTDAAASAEFTIVGRRDVNGAGAFALHDGSTPTEADHAGACFFFAAGSDGGRIAVDLGQVADVRQVNTYSWHTSTRGPQVYKLYAAEGSEKDFAAAPAGTVDPAKAGWKLLASVDTRPAKGDGGGQYGVSVRDSDGKVLGRFRYLLLDASATERDDPFGNTFFGEIDVIDGRQPPPATAPACTETAVADGKYEIVFDWSETPELKDWVQGTLKPACVEWYPKIVAMLPSEGFGAPRRLSVTFRKDMQGVAATGGTRVVCAGGWFSRNLKGEAAGAAIHELVHVVQQYGRGRRGRANPSWLVEGVADYIRWFLYEPADKRPRPNPDRARYTDSYRTTGAFLNYLVQSVDKEIVAKLNAAMREGKYSADLWKQCTGKSVDDLWAAYVETLRKR